MPEDKSEKDTKKPEDPKEKPEKDSNEKTDDKPEQKPKESSNAKEIKDLYAKIEELKKKDDKDSLLEKIKALLKKNKKEEDKDEEKEDKKPLKDKQLEALNNKVKELEMAQLQREAKEKIDSLCKSLGLKGEEQKQYFIYLMDKAESQMGPDDTFSEEALKEVRDTVLKAFKNQSTSVDEPKGKTVAPGGTAPSFEKYKKMSPLEKSKFFSDFGEDLTAAYEKKLLEDDGWRIEEKKSE